MRLLNTSTYELFEFFGKSIPKYAILSHRWEEDELLFTDIKLLRSRGGRKGKGWRKVKSFVAQALKDGHEWAWVDTCCIDKSSSAELSEAINSMFNFYKNAELCYAYLSDVPPHNGTEEEMEEAFIRSKWFTRGWTLQELLAPKEVVFYAKDWTLIGSSNEMANLIHKSTGIWRMKWQDKCVAIKMSWASRRETTRIEDMAYCLMGIFGVHMAPLYGEEENAFIRLQEEIMRVSDDDSIFAWRDVQKARGEGGLLASSPASFAKVPPIGTWEGLNFDSHPYSMTNKGLRLEMYLFPCQDPNWPDPVEDTYFAPLNSCERLSGAGQARYYAIYVRRVRGMQFIRTATDTLKILDQDEAGQLIELREQQKPTTTLLVSQGRWTSRWASEPEMVKFSIGSVVSEGFQISNRYVSTRCRWNISTSPSMSDVQLITDLLKGDYGDGSAALEFTRTSMETIERFAILISISLENNALHIGLEEVDTTFDELVNLLDSDEVYLQEVVDEDDGIQDSIELASGQKVWARYHYLGIGNGTMDFKVELWLS